MAMNRLLLILAIGMLAGSFAHTQSPPPIVIRAGALIDGTGKVLRDTTIVIEGSRIARLEPGTRPATYDLSTLTVLPGLIDTHVHIGNRTSAGRTSVRTR